MKFKVGDKVKILNKTTGDTIAHLRDIGNILEIERIDGDGSGRDEYNHIVINGNYYSESDLELVSEEYKVGDVVLTDVPDVGKVVLKLKDGGPLWSADILSQEKDYGFSCTRWTENYFVKKFQPGEHIEHYKYKNPRYFPEEQQKQRVFFSGTNDPFRRNYFYEMWVDESNRSTNQSLKKKTMRKLSELPGKIRRAMSQDAKVLFQAGYQDENGKWTSRAIEEADDAMILERCDQMKAEFVENAKEELEVERQEKED